MSIRDLVRWGDARLLSQNEEVVSSDAGLAALIVDLLDTCRAPHGTYRGGPRSGRRGRHPRKRPLRSGRAGARLPSEPGPGSTSGETSSPTQRSPRLSSRVQMVSGGRDSRTKPGFRRVIEPAHSRALSSRIPASPDGTGIALSS